MLKIILLISYFSIKCLCEKYQLEDFSLSSNSVNNFRRFIYANHSVHNKTLEKSGFSYNMTIHHNRSSDANTPFNHNETFHIYIIKSDVIPHFDLLNNPAICCSDEGGVICDDVFDSNNPKDKNEGYKLLKTHAIYTRDVNLTQNFITLIDERNFETKGIFYSLFLLCEPLNKSSLPENTIISESNNSTHMGEYYDDYSDRVFLRGEFSFYNTFGYLSAEEFYTVDIYSLISLYYFFLSLYWVYKIIIQSDHMNFYSKLVTLLLPIVILEKMMDLQIHSEINSSGGLNIAFTTIGIACYIIDNILIRIIFYAIALGYGFTINSFREISKKKVFHFSIILIGYIASIIVHYTLYSRYMFHETSLAYLILSFFFMYLTNIYILYKIYKGITKQRYYLARNKNFSDIVQIYSKITKIMKICIGLASCYALIQCVLKVFHNYDFAWKCKWMVDILYEIIPLTVLTTLIWILQENHSIINKHPSSPAKGYIRQMEESSEQQSGV